jgi:dihydroorotase
LIIDPHVHCRDGEKQRYKATIAGTIKLALEQGVGKIFDMPNTDPPIIRADDVRERMLLVPHGMEKHYRLYVGLTKDSWQVYAAVKAYNDLGPVIGLKLFAGHSVGNLSVPNLLDQRMVYLELVSRKFEGVLAVHCEKESLMHPELWDQANPFSHTLARPKEVEIGSVHDQISSAIAVGFQGILHVCHVSCPESVELIKAAKKTGLRITCGATPHHLMWDDSKLTGPDGSLYKMNPPLRSQDDVLGLRNCLVEGDIDWIETDHAPHALVERIRPPYLSGHPSLKLYRECVDNFLPSLGISQERIKDLTYGNIIKAFVNKL